MSISAIVRALIAAKATPEMILAAVEAAESELSAVAEISKEKARVRWRKWKANQPTNVSKRLQTDTNVGKRLVREGARVEDITSNLEISGQKENKQTTAPKARESGLADFKTELSELDDDRLEAIIKHRKAKRGQLSGHAARLFRKDAADCGLPLSEAVDACISRNWITVKPEYFAGRQNARAGPVPKPNIFDVCNDIIREKGLDNGRESLRRADNHAQQFPEHVGHSIDAGKVVDLRGGIGRRYGRGDM